MNEVFQEHRRDVVEKDLQMPDDILEVIGSISKSQATVLLADEEKRRRKRARR
ncbi:hypothetical protein [Methanothrix harundinacea]|jgi:hypothetical protein|uniref:hypothetical protein n=1 Tax=Methanothrix harundinacea TaxID=301375 RepID=UPI000B31AF0F|nr:hypothetical protein [Methanothrix harundinacea]